MRLFEWKWCELCGHATVICPECGNNCCNGGYGTVDGKYCKVCPEAYKHYDNTPGGEEPTREECSGVIEAPDFSSMDLGAVVKDETPPVLDMLGSLIVVGDQIAYATRSSSSVYMNVGTILEFVESKHWSGSVTKKIRVQKSMCNTRIATCKPSLITNIDCVVKL